MNNKQLLNELKVDFKDISKKISKLLDYISSHYMELDKVHLGLLETQGSYMMKYRDTLLVRMNELKFNNEAGDTNENIK